MNNKPITFSWLTRWLERRKMLAAIRREIITEGYNILLIESIIDERNHERERYQAIEARLAAEVAALKPLKKSDDKAERKEAVEDYNAAIEQREANQRKLSTAATAAARSEDIRNEKVEKVAALTRKYRFVASSV